MRCPKCDSMHLIADRLGVFEDGNWDIQKYLQSHGENVKVVNTENDILELTKNDFVGNSNFDDIESSKDNKDKNKLPSELNLSDLKTPQVMFSPSVTFSPHGTILSFT